MPGAFSMRVTFRIAGVFTLLLAAFGLQSTLLTLLAVSSPDLGAADIGTRAGSGYLLFLMVVNVLDLIAYAGFVAVGVGLLGIRAWVARPALAMGLYSMVMPIVQVGAEYVYALRPEIDRAAAAGHPGPPLGWLVLHFLGAGILFAFGARLTWLATRPAFHEALGRSAPTPAVPRAPAPPVPSGRTVPKGRIRLATNAPAHWPRITVEGWSADVPALNFFTLVGALTKAAEQSHLPLTVKSFTRAMLMPEGVLMVPLVLAENGQEIPVFVYPDAGPAHSSHFAGARRLLRAAGFERVVYYSSEAITPAAPADPLRMLTTNCFELCKEEEVPPGDYAMFWGEEGGEEFLQAPGLAAIERAYRAMDGIETYLFGVLASDLEMTKEPPGRLALPEDGLWPVKGPEERILLISASQEKGLRFHFPVKETPAAYRDRIWSLFASYCELFRQELSARQAELDGEERRHGLGAWTALLSYVRQNPPAGGQALLLGRVARDAVEEAAGPVPPAPERGSGGLAEPLYPCLKEASWFASVSVCRRLTEEGSPEYIPWVAYGYDQPYTFEFLSEAGLGELKRTREEVEAEAVRNLRAREASWQAVEVEIDEGGTMNLLVCGDDFLAAERILDATFMKIAQQRLGAQGLLVGIPRRGRLFAMNGEAGEEAGVAFVAMVATEYHRPASAPVSPVVFAVKDGAIVGVIEGGAKVGAARAEEDAEADPDDPYITILTVRDAASGLEDVRICAGGGDFDRLSYGVLCALAEVVTRERSRPAFSGRIEVAILAHTPAEVRARLPELEQNLRGAAQASGPTPKGRPIEVSLGIQESSSFPSD